MGKPLKYNKSWREDKKMLFSLILTSTWLNDYFSIFLRILSQFSKQLFCSDLSICWKCLAGAMFLKATNKKKKHYTEICYIILPYISQGLCFLRTYYQRKFYLPICRDSYNFSMFYSLNMVPPLSCFPQNLPLKAL